MKVDSFLIFILSISLKIEYLHTISIDNYNLNEPIAFQTKDFDQTALYNKQAFGLINLLDILKIERKQTNLRNVTADQIGLKSFVRLSNNMLDYSNLATNESNVTTSKPEFVSKLHNNVDIKPKILPFTNDNNNNVFTKKKDNFLEDEVL